MNRKNSMLFLTRDVMRNGFSFYLRQRDPGDVLTYYAQPIVLKGITEEQQGYEVDPFMTLPKETVQELMNELWRNGFRPDKYEADTGALEQARIHINDLRAIAFKQLGITGEQE